MCLGPDIAFTVKDSARFFHGPTEYGFKRFKHPLRCIKVSLHDKMVLRPSPTLPAFSTMRLSSSPYGRLGSVSPSMRRSTSEALCLLCGCLNHSASKARSVIALFSVESDMYRIVTGTGEALHVLSSLLVAKLPGKPNHIM